MNAVAKSETSSGTTLPTEPPPVEADGVRASDGSQAIALSPLARDFVLHWGEMGSRWGVNRTVAQIHALLYHAGRPLNADQITDTLAVARSNVSNSLRELQSWRLVRTVHVMGDRRDHYETSLDVWDLMRTVVAERKRREFEPTVSALSAQVNHPDFLKETPEAQARVKEMLELTRALSSWADEMLRLESGTLQTILKLGAKVQQFVRGSKRARTATS